MAAKRTCGRYVTPFNCISGDFCFGCSGGSGGSGGFVSVFRVLVHAS